MTDAVKNNVAVREIPQPETTTPGNISYRANPNNNLERTPSGDSYEGKKSNTGKVVGIIGGIIAAAAVIVGGICFHKGSKALGEDAKFMEKLKKGWEELCGKGKKPEPAAEAPKAEPAAEANGLKEFPQTSQEFKDALNAGKLNYEIEVEGNRVIVENGKVKECFNANNERWYINEKTDKTFADKINAEVEKKNAEKIAEGKGNTPVAEVKTEGKANAATQAETEANAETKIKEVSTEKASDDNIKKD